MILIAGLGALAIDHAMEDGALAMEQGVTAGRLSPRRAALEAALNQPLLVLRGVAGFLSVRWGAPNLDAEFDGYAAYALAEGGGGIRSIQYLRDGVITHSQPLAGNEPALGRNVADDPRPGITRDYRAAAENGGVALSGPTDLFQGGRGLIGRLRVPLEATAPVVVAGIIIDIDTMLAQAGLPDLAEVTWRLRDAEGQRIAGTAELDTTFGGIVSLPVRLPDRVWTLEGVPQRGWVQAVNARRLPLRINLLIGVLALGVLAGLLRARALATRRAEATEERERAEAKFQHLFELVPDGVVLAQVADARILEVNEAYCRIFRRPRHAMIGRTMHELDLMATEEEQAAALAELEATGAQSEMPFAIRLPDGTQREGIYTSVRVVVDGTPCYLSIVRDVQDRRTIEQRLAEAQRLEAIGRLAGGIAHDFNNLITGISGYADLIRADLPAASPRHADLAEITRAAGRAAELTRQLLTFARRQVTAPRVVDLGELAREASGLLQQLVGDRVTLVLELPDTPLPVRIDPVQFEQVLTNLATNARDAMPAGGLLVIAGSVVGGAVEVRVSDTGTGIAPEHLPHLFEPFYTTKGPGAGTGLGLAMVHGIIEQAGGAIAVESPAEQGTTFRLRFPMAQGHVVAAETPAPTRAMPVGGGEVILLAEDEPQVRTLAARVLERLGYTVLAAADGSEALALAAAQRGPLDLLLTDMVMPRMGGGELVRRLRTLHPDLRVLVMSGYSEEIVAREHPDFPFLPKPFTPQELGEAVRRALAG